MSVWIGISGSPAAAADFYVSAGGADGNPGTSPLVPWRTLARVNAVALRPGDRIFLRSGDTFFGGLSLDAADVGTAASPIEIALYGGGRAIIYAGTGAGIFAYNTAGISISNLAVAGAGGTASGITFYTDLPGDVRLPFIRIDNVDVGGFGRDGIEIGAWQGASGFADVRVTHAARPSQRPQRTVHPMRSCPDVHQQVYVGHVRAYENHGTAGAASNTGSGIVLASVAGGTIERSVAHDNGRLCDCGRRTGRHLGVRLDARHHPVQRVVQQPDRGQLATAAGSTSIRTSRTRSCSTTIPTTTTAPASCSRSRLRARRARSQRRPLQRVAE